MTSNLDYICEAMKDATAFLSAYGDFKWISDDDTDYLPAALECFQVWASIRCDDDPELAAESYIKKLQRLEDDHEGEHLMDLATIDFSTPLVADFFDSELYYERNS